MYLTFAAVDLREVLAWWVMLNGLHPEKEELASTMLLA